MNNHENWRNIYCAEADLYKIRLRAIVEDYDGLKIYLTIDSFEKFLLFESFESYSVLGSSAREQRLKNVFIDIKSGIFFKAIDSDYLKRLSVESSKMSDLLNLNHFVIVTNSVLIEVISVVELPKLNFQQNKQ